MLISQTQLFPNIYATLTYLLSYYPEFVCELPALLVSNAQVLRLNSVLECFGLSVPDLYYGNMLKQNIIDFIKSDNLISKNHVISTLQKVRDKSKSKKFKETYARKKGIIY